MRWFKKPESNRSVRKSKDELHDYWRSPDEMNNPSSYLQASKRIEYLVSLVKQYVKPNASILELGCNVGRAIYTSSGRRVITREGELNRSNLSPIHRTRKLN